MSAPLWLIAERELRTYVATASFWAALAVGPLAALALMVFAGSPAPTIVSIVSANRDFARYATAAVVEAASLEGRTLVVGSGGEKLAIAARGENALEVSFSSEFPLSPAGRVLVARTLERDAESPSGVVAAVTVQQPARAPGGPGVAGVARFASMCMLWLTLTGSLGMLLQAVVRERANRALESLLAAARPWEIVAGKLAGVGAVSLVVLGAWLGSAVCLSAFMPHDTGASVILAKLAAPAALGRAAVIYVLAYAFYGSVTIAIGALARDVAAAQNLSQPMFTVLVIAFFVTMGSTGHAGAGWLVFVPAFTPFLLLVAAPDALSIGTQIFLLVILLGCALAAAAFAVACLSVTRLRITDVLSRLLPSFRGMRNTDDEQSVHQCSASAARCNAGPSATH